MAGERRREMHVEDIVCVTCFFPLPLPHLESPESDNINLSGLSRPYRYPLSDLSASIYWTGLANTLDSDPRVAMEERRNG